MPRIGNIYGHGFDKAQISLMERLGFSIRPQVSTYAGAQECRFIDFEKGPCLELVEVRSRKEYLDFVPEGMRPYCPGIAVVLSKDSEKDLPTFAREFGEWHPYALHENYDGTSDPGKPGWNYLNFGTPVVPDVFIWLTTIDEPRPARAPIPTHANGVSGILGLVFDLESSALKRLAELVGEDPVDGVFDIGGVKVWSRKVMRDFPMTEGKSFPLRAVVLKAGSLDHFRTHAEDATETSFMSRRALHIATNGLSWDLLIVQQ